VSVRAGLWPGLTAIASNRQAVRSGQVEGCDSCHERPRANGDLCIACDRKMPGPRLKELSVGSTTFADGKRFSSIVDISSSLTD
jgi:hypothetical protein